MTSPRRLLYRVGGPAAPTSDRRVLLLLLAFAIVRGILYAFLNPPFLGPDEAGHYNYLSSLHASGGREVQGAESHQPPLYYWLSLPAYALGFGWSSGTEVYALAADQTSIGALLAVRVFSAMLAAGTVPLAYVAARAACPKDRLVYLGSAAFVAFLPMYGSIGASVNNDVLANLVGSALVAMTAVSLSSGFTPRRIAAVAALIGIGLAAKASTWGVIGGVLLVGAARGLGWASGRRLGRLRVSWIVLLAALMAMGTMAALMTVGSGTRGSHFSTSRVIDFVTQFDGLPLVYQFTTFWATFYYDSIRLPWAVYWLLAALCGVSALGIVFGAARALRQREEAATLSLLGSPAALRVLFVGLVVLAQWSISLGRYYLAVRVPPWERVGGWSLDISLWQGRFLFPAIIPIAIAFLWGLSQFVPHSRKAQAAVALGGILLAVDALSLISLLAGFYSWRH